MLESIFAIFFTVVIATTFPAVIYLLFAISFNMSSILRSVLSIKIYATYFSFPLSNSLHIKYPSPFSSFSTSSISAPYNASFCATSTSAFSSVCSAAYIVTFPLVTSIAPAISIAPSCLTILLFITSS